VGKLCDRWLWFWVLLSRGKGFLGLELMCDISIAVMSIRLVSFDNAGILI
jgi:hypothetical protein